VFPSCIVAAIVCYKLLSFIDAVRSALKKYSSASWLPTTSVKVNIVLGSKTDIEQFQLKFMGQGRYTRRSVSDPVYLSQKDYHAQFITVRHI